MEISLLIPDREALLEKWRPVLDATRHIFTWTSPAELAWLAEYATRCHRLLEIGSYVGKSAKVMLLANPDLHIYSLDAWDDEDTHETYQHHLRHEIAAGRVEWIKGQSHDSLNTLDGTGDKFDGVFIDGGHLEADVIGDIVGITPLIHAGLLICGHDYRNDPNDGVDKAVNRMLPQRTNPIDSIWAAYV